jgi:chemotaxis protein MotB
MDERLRKLLGKVAEIIKKLPNKIKISGHTDAQPFAAGSERSNWDLSAERANASRRALEQLGVAKQRIAQVVGMADRDPIEPNDPFAPENRRISIVLLRQRTAGGTEEQPIIEEGPTATETTLPSVRAQNDTGSNVTTTVPRTGG